jgi:hypothetical protein
MSTQIDHAQAARAARTIRVAPAAAIGLALLVVGLATGLTFGWLQTGSAERAAPTPVTSPLAPDNTPRTSPPQRQPDPSSAPTAPVTPQPIREVHQGDRLCGRLRTA